MFYEKILNWVNLWGTLVPHTPPYGEPRFPRPLLYDGRMKYKVKKEGSGEPWFPEGSPPKSLCDHLHFYNIMRLIILYDKIIHFVIINILSYLLNV